jgi:hypothetical protein
MSELNIGLGRESLRMDDGSHGCQSITIRATVTIIDANVEVLAMFLQVVREKIHIKLLA